MTKKENIKLPIKQLKSLWDKSNKIGKYNISSN